MIAFLAIYGYKNVDKKNVAGLLVKGYKARRDYICFGIRKAAGKVTCRMEV